MIVGLIRHLVYGLVGTDRLVHYIGKTTRGVARPLHKASQLGGMWEITVLETCHAPDIACKAERWWIAYGRACGWPLLNVKAGGEGRVTPRPTTRQTRVFRGELYYEDDSSVQRMTREDATWLVGLVGLRSAARLVGIAKSTLFDFVRTGATLSGAMRSTCPRGCGGLSGA